MIQQTSFEASTGLPRWGCMFMSLVMAAFKAAGEREPTVEEVTAIYHDCLAELTPKWVGGVASGEVPVLAMVNPLTFEIYVNNPTTVITKALSYAGPGWRGGQVPDADLFVPTNYPRDYKCTFTLLNFRRPLGDGSGHWILGDRSGRNIVYDPNENLELDYWNRSPKWRSLRFWRV